MKTVFKVKAMKEKDILLDELFSLERKGIKPGLERTLYLVEQSGNPHNNFPTIHIAGTNGKGTTSSIIASVLHSSGYKVGLYTSPHILDFNERIRIGGEKISNDSLIRLAKKYLTLGKDVEATFFEVTTAIAFEWFSEEKVDVAVIETGMGGRYDSTNIINPMISVICSVDLDHIDYLGDTLEAIAFEKAGIIKQGVPVVIGEEKALVLKILTDYANSKESEVVLLNENDAEFINYDKDYNLVFNVPTYFTKYEGLVSPLRGKHQLKNHSIALTTLEKIRRRFPFTNAHVSDGVRQVVESSGLSNRIEIRSKNPLEIFDVAHNPAAIEKLTATIDEIFPSKKFTILYGAMSDKDNAKTLKILKEKCSSLVLTQPTIKRSASIDELSKIAEEHGYENMRKISNPYEAYQTIKKAGEDFIVVGSFYLIGEILQAKEKQ